MSEELVVLSAGGSLPVDSPFHTISSSILEKFPLHELKIAHENTQFAYAYEICGAVSLDNDKRPVFCTRKAGLDTEHEGRGRCYRHEQALATYRSPYIRELRGYANLQEIYSDFLNREKKLNDLSEEISIARTMLSHQLAKFDSSQKGYKNDETFRNILPCLEMIRKIAESVSKIQQQESLGITETSITGFLWQISEILSQEITSDTITVRILERIASECKFTE